jgi:hypothetical protein
MSRIGTVSSQNVIQARFIMVVVPRDLNNIDLGPVLPFVANFAHARAHQPKSSPGAGLLREEMWTSVKLNNGKTGTGGRGWALGDAAADHRDRFPIKVSTNEGGPMQTPAIKAMLAPRFRLGQRKRPTWLQCRRWTQRAEFQAGR